MLRLCRSLISFFEGKRLQVHWLFFFFFLSNQILPNNMAHFSSSIFADYYIFHPVYGHVHGQVGSMRVKSYTIFLCHCCPSALVSIGPIRTSPICSNKENCDHPPCRGTWVAVLSADALLHVFFLNTSPPFHRHFPGKWILRLLLPAARCFCPSIHDLLRWIMPLRGGCNMRSWHPPARQNCSPPRAIFYSNGSVFRC